MSRPSRLSTVGCVAVLTAACATTRPKIYDASCLTPVTPARAEDTRSVILVGNNWDGTVHVIDANVLANPNMPEREARLKVIDVAPDRDDRFAEMVRGNDLADVKRRLSVDLAFWHVGQGHHQFVDDAFPSKDGRFIFASRPTFGDVVKIDVASGKLVWRGLLTGWRADHAALSRDGTALLVSDSLEKRVHRFSTVEGPRREAPAKPVERSADLAYWLGGKEVDIQPCDWFRSGDQPHESNYSADGSRIYHASIGLVFIDSQSRFANRFKGERIFRVLKADDLQILKTYDIREMLRKSKSSFLSKEDREWRHSAIRPMAITKNDVAYLQLSFLFGFVEFNLKTEEVVRMVHLSNGPPEPKYVLNSAHHGITLNGTEDTLCVAATIEDKALIVPISSLGKTNADGTQMASEMREYQDIKKPYWATTSEDGRYCLLSASDSDELVIVPFDGAGPVRRIMVGNHPQRVRTGALLTSALR